MTAPNATADRLAATMSDDEKRVVRWIAGGFGTVNTVTQGMTERYRLVARGLDMRLIAVDVYGKIQLSIFGVIVLRLFDPGFEERHRILLGVGFDVRPIPFDVRDIEAINPTDPDAERVRDAADEDR